MRRRRILALVTIVVCLLSAVLVALAAEAPALERWVFGSGGGPSEGTGVTMHGTLGQAVIGASSGEGVLQHGGYEEAAPQQREAVYLPLVMRNH